MAITVRDVARHAGVSAMSVSRVVNDKPGVSAETRARVEAAIAELDYAPSGVASSLLSSHSQLIGMVVPDVSNPFFGPIVHGAEAVARRAGYRLLLCNSESDLRLERDYVSDLVKHRVEGLIIAPAGDASLAHLRRLAERRFPMVLVDRSVAGLPCDSVTLDNFSAADKLIAHLLSLGHRRIALLIDSSDVSTSRERLAGATRALATAGIGLDEALVFRTSTDLLGGFRATQQALAAARRPTAIFALNNMIAVGAIQAVRQAGLSVPGDISLVCFDDVPHLAVVAPILTVIDQPADEMARVAAQLLLERISGAVRGEPRTVKFPGTLVVRSSVAAV